jgi:hypothetical protein
LPILRASFQVEAPPTEVLARIKARASLWRESLVPPELKRRGVSSVEVVSQHEYFELFAPSYRDPPPTDYRFLGTVRAHGSGSLVDVEVGVFRFARVRREWWILGLVGASVAWYVVGISILVLAATVMAFVSVFAWLRNSDLARGTDPLVEFYFELLQRALEPEAETEARAG